MGGVPNGFDRYRKRGVLNGTSILRIGYPTIGHETAAHIWARKREGSKNIRVRLSIRILRRFSTPAGALIS